MATIPETQGAVQLIGPDKLTFNDSKKVHRPGAHQILCRVETVGLCFSDLKLLKQFSSHVRKSELVSGIELDILNEIPSYVPGELPTVPGHEAVVRIAEVGSEVIKFKVGQRYLVQADYRWLRTATSNGAFGYNFEGALQQYVLLDERVITSPDGESMLIPVSEKLSGSAAALVEPWACVEDAYASKERRYIKGGGKTLIVADAKPEPEILSSFFHKYGKPDSITWLSSSAPPENMPAPIKAVKSLSETEDAVYDDILYFGCRADTAEQLFEKPAVNGLINLILCGGKFGRKLTIRIGTVHYGGKRVIGTTSSNPADSMKVIPETDELREGDRVNVVGAGGPMGTMHVIRNICQVIPDVTILAGDVDEGRLQNLSRIAAPPAREKGVDYRPYNSKTNPLKEPCDYTAIMAPIPALAAEAVENSANRAMINIFAGIPTNLTADIDLDSYINKQLYFIGTSGSTLEDMKLVLEKVETGRLDTNTSVAAVCGLADAVNGIRAVEKRLIPGKIVVYPECTNLDLTPLEELKGKMPELASCLNNGVWTKEAEQKLLKNCP